MIGRRGGGQLVISLDFELHWGNLSRPLAQERARLIGTRDAIPRLLSLFESFGVHATWATVGFLFADGVDELRACLPDQRPRYADESLDPYLYIERTNLGHSESQDPVHFAPSLIRKILDTPGQEVGSHSFSHYRCLDDMSGPNAFAADLAAARRVAARFNIELRSFVFARNQFTPRYLREMTSAGITAYRGNSLSSADRPRRSDEQHPMVRAYRFLGSYLPLAHSAAPVRRTADGPVDIPANRFLRPYTPRLRALEPLKVRRVVAELRAAARRDRTYHLWWHPENIGLHTDESLEGITVILREFDALRTQHGMVSMAMRDCVDPLPAA